MLKHVAFSMLIGLVGVGGFVAQARAAPAPASPKAIVLAFYKLALEDFKPAEAFARYAATDFVEHAQDSAGGTQAGTVAFMKKLIARSPQSKFEVVRVIAEGDLVFVHTRYTADSAAPQIAIAEIFRLRDGKLAEHWDVVSGPPDKVLNPNSRF